MNQCMPRNTNKIKSQPANYSMDYAERNNIKLMIVIRCSAQTRTGMGHLRKPQELNWFLPLIKPLRRTRTLRDPAQTQVWSEQVWWRLRPLSLYGRRLSRTVPAVVLAQLVKIAADCQIFCARLNFHHFLWKSQKSIWLLSVLSLHRKFVHNHNCCPNSAATLLGS